MTCIQREHISEYDQVTYQIKGNEMYNKMQTTILSLHTPSPIGMKSKGQTIFSPESGHVTYQIMGKVIHAL